jgi:NAD(P)-dependent dehydrogenase (short-subunit alcohol dehydrogenase family)
MPSKNGRIDVRKEIDYASLKGRNVLVTGAASGLGKGFVHMFAEHGAHVVVADLQDGPGRALEQELAGKGGRSVWSSSRCGLELTSPEHQIRPRRRDVFPVPGQHDSGGFGLLSTPRD